MRLIKRIFVHCTAGPQTQTVAQIQEYWKKVNKWVNPGYHYIIKPNGEIVPLQPEDKASNGVAGYNSTSINVCYIGGVDKLGKPVDNRTWEQKESLKYILKDLKKRYPDAEILGHREIWGDDPKNWKKMCPCFPAKEEYKHLMDEPEEEKIPEISEPSVPEESVESGEVISTNPRQEEPIVEHDIARPNPLDFIVKIIIKLFEYVIQRIFARNRASRNGGSK